MATKVVVCPECESALEPGRFSCPSCGTLVAAIASTARSFTPVPESVPPVLESAPDAAAALPADAPRSDAADGDALDDEGWDLPEAEPEPEAAAAAALSRSSLATPASFEPMPPATSWPEPPAPPVAPTRPARPTGLDPDWQDVPAPAGQAAPVAQPAPAEQPAPLAPPAWPEQPAWPPTSAGPVALEPPVRTPAGAYLPPSAVLPPGEALPVAGQNGNGNGHAVAAPATASTSLAERFALGDADGPLGLPANAAGRTIALGAAIAGLGFLLPWAEIVIGSTSVGGFLDMWGLAGPGHPLVLLLLIGVGFLAVAHEKWPVRVGAGTAAIVLGSVLLGLAFPYVMGPFREAVGVYVTAAGAAIMIAGGLLARVPPRHADAEASV
jgi:hypothetical protein